MPRRGAPPHVDNDTRQRVLARPSIAEGQTPTGGEVNLLGDLGAVAAAVHHAVHHS